MEETRIQSVAKTLLQICVTILPIGAGASSFISQQEYSFPILTALGLVWLGLIAISYCSFLLLKVLQFERGSPQQIEDNRITFNTGIRIFILGTLLLVLSPAGLALDQIAPPKPLAMDLSSSTLAIQGNTASPLSRDIILRIMNIEEADLSRSYLRVEPLDKGCLWARKVKEALPAPGNDTWITSWRVTIRPTCPFGDELLQFKLWEDGQIVGQANLVVSINP